MQLSYTCETPALEPLSQGPAPPIPLRPQTSRSLVPHLHPRLLPSLHRILTLSEVVSSADDWRANSAPDRGIRGTRTLHEALYFRAAPSHLSTPGARCRG